MVLLHVKRGDESQFLLQAPGSTELEELTVQVTRVYNARLKVQRVCSGAAQRRGESAAGTVEPAPGRGETGHPGWGSGAAAARLSRAGWAGRVRFAKICKDVRPAGSRGDSPPGSRGERSDFGTPRAGKAKCAPKRRGAGCEVAGETG